jgi:hypothetical protein
MLLNDYNPNPLYQHHPQQQQQTDQHTFIPNPNEPATQERQRLQEYCRKQLEALTCIRKEILRDEQDTLDMTSVSKFHFWNKMLQKERQVHAEEVAELKLKIRELRSALDEVMDVLYLVPFSCSIPYIHVYV